MSEDFNPFFAPAYEATSFRQQYFNAGLELRKAKRELYCARRHDIANRKRFTLATNERDVNAVFRTLTHNNLHGALALPHVVVWLVNGDLDAQAAAAAPFGVVRARRRLLARLACVAFAFAAILRLSRDFIIARWFDAVVPAAFAARPEIRFLHTCERRLVMYAIARQRAVNRKTFAAEAPAMRFTLESVGQLRSHPGANDTEKAQRRAMLADIEAAFAHRLVTFR